MGPYVLCVHMGACQNMSVGVCVLRSFKMTNTVNPRRFTSLVTNDNMHYVALWYRKISMDIICHNILFPNNDAISAEGWN